MGRRKKQRSSLRTNKRERGVRGPSLESPTEARERVFLKQKERDLQERRARSRLLSLLRGGGSQKVCHMRGRGTFFNRKIGRRKRNASQSNSSRGVSLLFCFCSTSLIRSSSRSRVCCSSLLVHMLRRIWVRKSHPAEVFEPRWFRNENFHDASFGLPLVLGPLSDVVLDEGLVSTSLWRSRYAHPRVRGLFLCSLVDPRRALPSRSPSRPLFFSVSSAPSV